MEWRKETGARRSELLRIALKMRRYGGKLKRLKYSNVYEPLWSNDLPFRTIGFVLCPRIDLML